MTENKTLAPKPSSRVAKPKPSWRQIRRNMVISSSISKLTSKFKKWLAALASSSQRRASVKPAAAKPDECRAVVIVNEPKNSWRNQKRSMLLNKEVYNFTKTFRDSFVALVVSALGLVAALSWNDAIKTAIDTLMPSVGNVVYKFYVAMSVTVISVVITYFVSRIKPKN